MNTKKGWKALVLNFFVPGLGQVYSRRIKKGIALYILFFIVVFSLRFISYSFNLFIVAVCLIVGYYLYLLISGYKSVKKGEHYEPNKLDKWYFYILIIFSHIVFTNSLPRKTLDELTPINFASIPTPNMDPTLQVGDILAYKKIKTIQLGEVVIFKYPEDINTMYIKRCVGLPGDSLLIKRSRVFINGDTLQNIPSLKYKHLISTNGQSINSKLFERLSINDYYKVGGDNYLAHLTFIQAEELRQLGFIKNVEISIANKGDGDRMIFSDFHKETWNADYFGSIYLPKKGDVIALTMENLSLYSKIIKYENESVEFKESYVLINGKRIEQYEVKDNYYFMMGDNRDNSLDSRYWGFLPETLVVGRAMYLYWSATFDRIGKEVI